MLFTKETAKECGARGGVKSGEVRRQKRDMAALIHTLLSYNAKGKTAKDALKEITGTKVGSYYEAIVASQIVEAIKGNTKAFTALVEILEKPQTKQSKEEAMGDVLDNMRMALEDAGDE